MYLFVVIDDVLMELFFKSYSCRSGLTLSKINMLKGVVQFSDGLQLCWQPAELCSWVAAAVSDNKVICKAYRIAVTMLAQSWSGLPGQPRGSAIWG